MAGPVSPAAFCRHDDVWAIAADVTAEADCKRVVEAALDTYGRLDVLDNNVGVGSRGSVVDLEPSAWDKVMDINLKGPFFLTQKLLPLLRSSATYDNPARVINIASIDGFKNNPIETYSYAASKAGMVHLTRHMARNLVRENIVVNAIAPGPFESKMMAHTLETQGDQIRSHNPRRRIGRAEDMAATAIFLASRASDYIVGETIKVDGGIVNCS